MVVLGIIAGVGLRLYRALMGEMPPEKEKEAGDATGLPEGRRG